VERIKIGMKKYLDTYKNDKDYLFALIELDSDLARKEFPQISVPMMMYYYIEDNIIHNKMCKSEDFVKFAKEKSFQEKFIGW